MSIRNRTTLMACVLVSCVHAMPRHPPATRFDGAAVEALWSDARRHGTDSLVIVQDGEVALCWPREDRQKPLELMSVTKSIASLAIGQLVDSGRIGLLDEPMSTWIPEWRDGPHAAITLRMVMTHTSGLHDAPTTRAIYLSQDSWKHAIESPLDTPPGTAYRYNNNAANLLAAVVERAAGAPLDEYVTATLLEPLGITDVQWSRDGVGHPYAMAGLRMRAIDLARIGSMLADGGRWNGRQIVSAEWIATSTAPDAQLPWGGLLWWTVLSPPRYEIDEPLIGYWRAEGVPESFIAQVRPLVGESFDSWPALEAAMAERVGPGGRGAVAWFTWRRGLPSNHVPQVPVGFAGNGYLGQYVIVLPESRLVVVRQTSWRPGGKTEMQDVHAEVQALLSTPGGTGIAPVR